MKIAQPNPYEPSYCLDHMNYCANIVGPTLMESMSSTDFPWLNIFIIIALTLGQLT